MTIPSSSGILELMKINAKWHKANRMPRNPALEERITWNLEHAKNCGCRPISPKLQEIIDKGRRD